jgi:hypothetical protein
MRRAGLSELSSTNMLVVLLIIGLIFLSQTLDQQIQKVAELLSQAEATKPFLTQHPKPDEKLATGSEGIDAHDT